jgi:hypothetical protein
VPRVLVGNFDFEHELADGRSDRNSNAREISNELASAWVAMAEKEDLIWSPGGIPAFDFKEFSKLSGFQPRFINQESDLPRGPTWELVPWGWAPSVLNWGTKFGWTCPAPPLEVVKLVNSRLTRWELETELGVELPYSAACTTLEQLGTCIASFATRQPAPDSAGWVLKANFGMSGRERHLGRGPRMTDAVFNWARRRLQQSSAVVFEPWLNRVAEAGLQVVVPSQGQPRLLGVLPLITDPTGTYRGSRIQCPPSEIDIWKPATETALQVARELQKRGYFGPLGIDAMQYRDLDGGLQIRPLQDLNARLTMGRLGLELRRFVGFDTHVDWLHDRTRVAQLQIQSPLAKVVPITERSWLVEY